MWKNHPDTMQKSFHRYSIHLEKFFEVYSQYCKMNVSESNQKNIKTDLDQLADTFCNDFDISFAHMKNV